MDFTYKDKTGSYSITASAIVTRMGWDYRPSGVAVERGRFTKRDAIVRLNLGKSNYAHDGVY